MRRCLAAFVLLFFLLGSSDPLQAQESDANRMAAARATEILETTALWQDLFTGSDLAGWSGDTDGYVVEDGILVC